MNKWRIWFSESDSLLRGDTTRAVLAARGTAPLHLGASVGASVLLGAVYGLFMGLFAVLTRTPPCWQQLIATALKVPALFLLTLVVTFPSLYVFSALLGTRLRLIDVVRVLVGAIAVNLCMLAAFGPITGFFTISTTSYLFMKLLNVAFFTISGVVGLGFLVRLLHVLEDAPDLGLPDAPAGSLPVSGLPPARSSKSGAPLSVRSGPSRTTKVLAVWMVLYALVGAQMGWVLRPFVGNPGQAFTFFRARQANFFLDLLRSLGEFFR